MTNEERVKRMEQLLELVQMRRGWSKRKLASYLECDWRSMIRKNGDMSFKTLSRVATALDWRIESVAAALGEPDDLPSDEHDASRMSHEEAKQAATQASIEGDAIARLAYSRRAYDTAATPDERALSCIRECAAWGSRGHYLRAQEAVTRGLEEQDADVGLRRILESYLAGTYHYLWKLRESWSIATTLVTRIPAQETTPAYEDDPTSHRLCCARAEALYVFWGSLQDD